MRKILGLIALNLIWPVMAFKLARQANRGEIVVAGNPQILWNWGLTGSATLIALILTLAFRVPYHIADTCLVGYIMERVFLIVLASDPNGCGKS